MINLIDRRLNGRNKSAANRERFLRRYKEQIRRSVQDMVTERSITDMERGGEVSIPARDIAEPQFHMGPGGDRERVHPGNREFQKGDAIARPESGGGGAGGSQPGSGESVDDFVFSLSRDEFLDLFFDDLELPRLLRTSLGQAKRHKWTNAGFVSEGAPCNLSVSRTLKTALGRRIALSGQVRRQIDQTERRLELALLAQESDEAIRTSVANEARAAAEAGRIIAPSRDIDAPATFEASEASKVLTAELDRLRDRLRRVPFLDELDLRYRNRVAVPAPVSRAVMFCLMDVSASMDEARKDLAKRFFTLLYLFLTRKYERVELVFIRHTDNAEEVDEKTFFNDPKSGGTVVYTALELAHQVATERYGGGDWNVYLAQASDGDAFGADAGKSARFLADCLLPLARYFAYIEVRSADDRRASSLWAGYEALDADNFAMRHVGERSEIYPVFRELFSKEAA